jgi:hypothetical protein
VDEEKPKPLRGGFRSPTAGIPKRVSDAEWERWIETYRKHPGQIVKVAALMGCPRNRASIAWNKGWPRQGRPPVSELLEADKVLARKMRAEAEEAAVRGAEVVAEPPIPTAAELATPEASTQRNMALMVEREKTRKASQRDAALTRSEEGKLIKRARRNATELADVTGELLAGAKALMPRLRKLLEDESTDLTLKEGISFMQKLAVLTKLGTEASKMALQAERLAMGHPVGDDDVEGATGGALSPEHAAKWLQLGVGMLRRWGVSDESQSGPVEVRALSDSSSESEPPEPDDPAELAPGIGSTRSNLN